MKHILFTDNPSNTFSTAILIKESYFYKDKLEQYYVNPLEALGVSREDLVAFDLEYPGGKVTATQAKVYMKKLLKGFAQIGVSNILVADATYFKALTGLNKAESHIGYIHKCKMTGYEHINICYGLNYAIFMRNPNQIDKLDMALDTLANHLLGRAVSVGADVVKQADYHINEDEFEGALAKLHKHPTLVCDIETYSLELDKAGLGSIAFAYSKHEGTALYLGKNPSNKTKTLLKRFFESYKGTLIFHYCTFDIKNIIYTLFMEHPLDLRGMLHGLNILFRSTHDTKIIAYLATNATTGNELGLKPLSHPYMGNYAEDVSDITKLSIDKLLEYNLKDCLATYWVFEKYYPKMLRDNQLDIYVGIMLPSAKLITQMELHGMPMNMKQVDLTKEELETLYASYLVIINASRYVDEATKLIQLEALVAINSKLKTKQHTIERVADITFNPGSPKQLDTLIYTVMELPVLDKTPTGNPATGAATLEKLLHHTDDEDKITLINALIGLNKVSKILSTFIPAFQKAVRKGNWHYLHGSFNLGGTISGRLSSSNPNLQNIPSNSTYGKAVKKCFSAKPGWLFVGADFSSLEDRINALLTKDTNKLKVYIAPQTYEIILNGKSYCFDGNSVIEYRGQTITVKDYYERYCTKRDANGNRINDQ